MNITLENATEVIDIIKEKSLALGMQIVSRGTDQAFGVEKDDWGIEIIPENGWAYLHGYNALNSVGMNIADTDEFEDAISKMLTYKV